MSKMVARKGASSRRRSPQPNAGATSATDPLAPVEDPQSRVKKKKSKAKANPKKAERKDCVTCGRNLSKSSFPKSPTANCKHEITTCKACLKTWIETQLDTVAYDKLSCPECPERMNKADVEANARKATSERFQELQYRGEVEKIPGWRWCLNPSCKGGQVHQSPTRTTRPGIRKNRERTWEPVPDIFKCEECGAQVCVPCDRPYHTGETCEQYRERLARFEEEEQATLKTIAEKCKPCPTCGKNIQRNGGCDHMICTQCGERFCWLCVRTYTQIDGGDGHGPDCPYSIPGRFDPHAAHVQHAGMIPIGGWQVEEAEEEEDDDDGGW